MPDNTKIRNQLRKIIFSHSDIYSESDPIDLPFVDMQVDEIMEIVQTQRQEAEQEERQRMRMHVIGLFGQLLEKGHGGGNWRRLVCMTKDRLLAQLSTQSTEGENK